MVQGRKDINNMKSRNKRNKYLNNSYFQYNFISYVAFKIKGVMGGKFKNMRKWEYK